MDRTLRPYSHVKNIKWQIWGDADGYEHDQIQLAILMDIREELKKLNALLNCPRFMGIPSTLALIARNTSLKKKRTK